MHLFLKTFLFFNIKASTINHNARKWNWFLVHFRALLTLIFTWKTNFYNSITIVRQTSQFITSTTEQMQNFKYNIYLIRCIRTVLRYIYIYILTFPGIPYFQFYCFLKINFGMTSKHTCKTKTRFSIYRYYISRFIICFEAYEKKFFANQGSDEKQSIAKV